MISSAHYDSELFIKGRRFIAVCAPFDKREQARTFTAETVQSQFPGSCALSFNLASQNLIRLRAACTVGSASDRQRLASMSSFAADHAAEHFDKQIMIDRYSDIFDDVKSGAIRREPVSSGLA